MCVCGDADLQRFYCNLRRLIQATFAIEAMRKSRRISFRRVWAFPYGGNGRSISVNPIENLHGEQCVVPPSTWPRLAIVGIIYIYICFLGEKSKDLSIISPLVILDRLIVEAVDVHRFSRVGLVENWIFFF